MTKKKPLLSLWIAVVALMLVAVDTHASQVPPPPTPGWYLSGKANKPNPLPKDDNCRFGHKLIITNGGATGSFSWKEEGCNKQAGKGGCKGTYTGTVTWTVPPTYLKPGSAIPFKASASTVAKNTCGSFHIGSWVLVQDTRSSLYLQVIAGEAGQSKLGNTTWHVPMGKLGQTMGLQVAITAANLVGNATYSYVYR